MSKTTRKISSILTEKKEEGTKPFDSTAVVVRVEGDTVWVHMPGGVDETPAKKTINAKEGDIVQVRVANGSAWLVGNTSAPPTDDVTALRALKAANIAEKASTDALRSSESARASAEQAQATANEVRSIAEQAQADAEAASTAAAEADSKATAAGTAAAAAQTQAEAASTAAQAASTAAAEADSKATAAGTAAAAAQSSADSAAAAASAADSKAEAASTAAQAAQSSATAAGTAAAAAQTQAEAATTAAGTAGRAAAVAQAAAEAAQGDIDDLQEWFWHDTNGSHVLGATSGYRNDITSTGMEIIETATETSVASFGANGAQLGKSTGPHSVIDQNGQRFYGGTGGNTLLASIGYGEGAAETGESVNPYYEFGIRTTEAGYKPGNHSLIQGEFCAASGYVAHAEGLNTEARGNASHAEGGGTLAAGYASHAEGERTGAGGDYSHAEGSGTVAIGEASHAEGSGTVARGDYSHVEGLDTATSGRASHAQNIGTYARSDGQTVMGRYNLNKQNNAFEIGNGTADNVRSNALELDWSGNLLTAGSITDGSGNVLSNKVDASSLAAVATSGDYSDLTGTPILAAVATSGAYSDLSGTPNLAAVATSGDYSDLTGTPILATVATSGAYSDLSGTPSLAAVATSGAYSDLTGTPTLATVATSGSYNDLTNKPSNATTSAAGFMSSTDKTKLDKFNFASGITQLNYGDSTNTAQVWHWGNTTNKVGVGAYNNTDAARYNLLARESSLLLGKNNTNVWTISGIEGNVDINNNEYKAGDVVPLSKVICAGFVTNSTKSLDFQIPLPKDATGRTATLNLNASSGLSVRTGSGGYLNGTQYINTSSGYTITVETNASGLTCRITGTSAFTNVSNNEACSLALNGSITFS